MHNIPFITGGIDNLSRDSRSILRDVSVLYIPIYNTDTSREIDRLSRDKLSMPPAMKGILCIKFDLFKIKNTDFWAVYGATRLLGQRYDTIYVISLPEQSSRTFATICI